MKQVTIEILLYDRGDISSCETDEILFYNRSETPLTKQIVFPPYKTAEIPHMKLMNFLQKQVKFSLTYETGKVLFAGQGEILNNVATLQSSFPDLSNQRTGLCIPSTTY